MKITTIKTRIVITIMVTSLISLMVACVAFSLHDLSTYRSSKENEIKQLVALLSPLLVAQLEEPKTDTVLWKQLIAGNEDVQSLVLYRSNFTVADEYVARHGRGHYLSPEDTIQINFSGDYCLYNTPLRDGDRDVGYLAIDYQLSDRQYGFRSILLVFFSAFAFSAFIAYLISTLLHFQFSKSIISLVDVARSIYADKDYTVRAKKHTNDEFGLLTDTINEMVDEISRREVEMQNLNDHLESRVETRTAALQEINSRLLDEKMRADKASCVKSDFLANMSHEIRTPMNGIVASCDLAVAEDLSPKVANYLKIIQSSSHTLLSIINDILDYSKLEAGTLELEESQFSLGELFCKLGSVIRGQARENGIGFHMDIDVDVPDVLLGDRARFYQILSNLLDNAIKFTQNGSVSLHVVCLEEKDDSVVLECRVRDTGVGLSDEGLNAIFRSFHQIDSSSTKKFAGTGLGLAIIKRLVSIMGGTIEVSSKLGYGSSFVVTLRFARVHPSLVMAPDVLADTNPEVLYGKHALLAEDNETNRGIAEAMLTELGLTVDSVENGQMALELLADMEYDVVILDIQMPVLDGYDTMERIRAMDKYKDLPIIALTAHALPGDKERCLRAGADGYLSKPMSQGALRSLLCCLCAGSDLTKKIVGPKKIAELTSTPVLKAKVLDIEGAYSKLGVDSKIYYKILTTFCLDYQHFETDFNRALAEDDFEWIKKKIHSLKGSSATIGAQKLSIEATRIDSLCKEGVSPDSEMVNTLFAELQQVQLVAKQFVDQSPAPSDDDGELQILNEDDLEIHLERLAKGLDESLYDQINTEIKVIEEKISGSLIIKLGKMIRMYAYDDALELLYEVGEELGVPLDKDEE